MIQPSLMDQSEESSVPYSRLGIKHNQIFSKGLNIKIYLDLIEYICICGLSFLFGCGFVLFLVFWWCSSNVLIKTGHLIHMSQSL